MQRANRVAESKSRFFSLQNVLLSAEDGRSSPNFSCMDLAQRFLKGVRDSTSDFFAESKSSCREQIPLFLSAKHFALSRSLEVVTKLFMHGPRSEIFEGSERLHVRFFLQRANRVAESKSHFFSLHNILLSAEVGKLLNYVPHNPSTSSQTTTTTTHSYSHGRPPTATTTRPTMTDFVPSQPRPQPSTTTTTTTTTHTYIPHRGELCTPPSTVYHSYLA